MTSNGRQNAWSVRAAKAGLTPGKGSTQAAADTGRQPCFPIPFQAALSTDGAPNRNAANRNGGRESAVPAYRVSDAATPLQGWKRAFAKWGGL